MKIMFLIWCETEFCHNNHKRTQKGLLLKLPLRNIEIFLNKKFVLVESDPPSWFYWLFNDVYVKIAVLSKLQAGYYNHLRRVKVLSREEKMTICKTCQHSVLNLK